MMARYGMVVDLNRCTGCLTCMLTCKEENLTPPGEFWIKVSELPAMLSERVIYMPILCVHCEKPPCVDACPSRAIYKRPDGIVLIDQEKCTGKLKCIEACPYNVITRHPEIRYFPGLKLPYEEDVEDRRLHKPGLSGKCTLCVHRVEQGREPACVDSCPSKALFFGNLDDSNSSVAKMLKKAEPFKPELDIEPKIFYIKPQSLNLAALHQKPGK